MKTMYQFTQTNNVYSLHYYSIFRIHHAYIDIALLFKKLKDDLGSILSF